MLISPFTTLRSQKSRPSEAGEPSVRTTLMPRSFLAIDWPLRFMYLIVNQHQTMKPTSVTTAMTDEHRSGTGIVRRRCRGAADDGDNQHRQVDHHHEDDAIEDRRAQPRAAIRGGRQHGRIGDIPDDGPRWSVGICRDLKYSPQSPLVGRSPRIHQSLREFRWRTCVEVGDQPSIDAPKSKSATRS